MNANLPPRDRTIVLVGLMGVGKSSVGRRLAAALNMPFKDVDTEVEQAAARPISEIFAELGETAFRDGERRVIARLLDDPPHVMATGGGAFMNEQTRALVKEKAISIWLKADFDVLARRVGRRDDRPLLRGRDPVEVLREQAAIRYPQFEEADLTVQTEDQPHQATVDSILASLNKLSEETSH
jgi:shikimate kinase